MEVRLKPIQPLLFVCMFLCIAAGCEPDEDVTPEVIEGQNAGECNDAIDNDGDGFGSALTSVCIQ